MATKRENSDAFNGKTPKRARISIDELQTEEQDQPSEEEKLKIKTINGALINNSLVDMDENESNDKSYINNISPSTPAHNKLPSLEQNKVSALRIQEEHKTMIQNDKPLNNTNNDTASNSSYDSDSDSNPDSTEESCSEDSKDFNSNDVASFNKKDNSTVNEETTYQQNEEENQVTTLRNIFVPILKQTDTSNNGEDAENGESTLHSASNVPTAETNENIQYLENLLIMQLKQRKQKTWYPSRFESGIYALTKFFTKDNDDDDDDDDDDVEEINDLSNQTNKPESAVTNSNDCVGNQTSSENNINKNESIQNTSHENTPESRQNLQKQALQTIAEQNNTSVEENTNENSTANVITSETQNQVNISNNLELFDDRSTVDANIEEIMTNAENWSVQHPVPFQTMSRNYYLEGVNNIFATNAQYAVEEYETDSLLNEDSEDSSVESDDDDSRSSAPRGAVKIEPMTKIEPQVIEIFRVDVKTEVTPDDLVHYEKYKVERTLHSIKNVAQMRRLQKILELNSIPRPLERGADKFNMILGEIPDIIEVLKAYPDSSHQVHVRIINPEQENFQSLVGDVYIKNNPRKMVGDCPICMYTFGDDPVSTLCGHVFCENCLVHAIQYHKQCPSCRKQLRSPYYHKIFI